MHRDVGRSAYADVAGSASCRFDHHNVLGKDYSVPVLH